MSEKDLNAKFEKEFAAKADLRLAFALNDIRRWLDEANHALLLRDRTKALEIIQDVRTLMQSFPITNEQFDFCPCKCICGIKCDHKTCPCSDCVKGRNEQNR